MTSGFFVFLQALMELGCRQDVLHQQGSGHGAAAAGNGRDIGRHFPDNDERFAGASSMNLLIHVKKLLEERGAHVVNIDATVVLQKPKLFPYIEKMRDNIAFCLSINKENLNIKATTEEHLGFTGRGEGVSAHAVALVKIKN